jgi:protein disulfide-isomerase
MRAGIASASMSSPSGGGGSVGAPSPSAIGLDGYCPVTLFETRKWRRADPQWGVVHRDRTYLFVGRDQQQRFLEDPDRYAPMLSGYDPVRYLEQGQLVEGRRQHGLWYRNQMFLFADEASLEQFWKNAEAFAPRVEQAMQGPVAGGPLRR